MRQLRGGNPTEQGGARSGEHAARARVPHVERPCGRGQAGHDGGVPTARGGNDRAAVASARRALLSLPRVPADPIAVPREIVLERGAQDAAWLAEALLDIGVLQPSDWNGSLDKSIGAGVARWMDEQIAPYTMTRLGSLDFEIGNRVAELMEDNESRGHRPWNLKDYEAKQFGALGFRVDVGHAGSVVAASVGTRIKALNKLYPDAGWSILRLIEDALDESIGGMTPSMARANAEENAENYMEMQEEADDEEAEQIEPGWHDRLGNWNTFKEFDKAIPVAAASPRLNEIAIYRLAADIESGLIEAPPWARAAALAAAALLRIDKGTCENDTHRFEQARSLPVLIRWHAPPQDMVGAMFDDYHNEAWDGDGLTECCYISIFRIGERRKEAPEPVVPKPGRRSAVDDRERPREADWSIDQSIRALGTTLQVMRCLDILIAALDSQSAKNKTYEFTPARAKTLAHIFRDDVIGYAAAATATDRDFRDAGGI